MSEYVIELPYIPESLNKLLKLNHWDYSKHKKKVQHDIANLVSEKGKIEPFVSCIVTLEYYFRTRRNRDLDNYSGKFLLDALTRANVLKDDHCGIVKELRIIIKVDLGKTEKTNIIIRAV